MLVFVVDGTNLFHELCVDFGVPGLSNTIRRHVRQSVQCLGPVHDQTDCNDATNFMKVLTNELLEGNSSVFT